MYNKIVVCLDGSSLAEQIMPDVIELAAKFNSKLELLQVVPSPRSLSKPETEVVSEKEIIDRTLEEIETEKIEATQYLIRVSQPLREKGLDIDCVVIQGVPGTSIVNYAHENDVELIAIATHGRGGLQRLVFGSVSDYVLRFSGLPILLIRPKPSSS